MGNVHACSEIISLAEPVCKLGVLKEAETPVRSKEVKPHLTARTRSVLHFLEAIHKVNCGKFESAYRGGEDVVLGFLTVSFHPYKDGFLTLISFLFNGGDGARSLPAIYIVTLVSQDIFHMPFLFSYPSPRNGSRGPFLRWNDRRSSGVVTSRLEARIIKVFKAFYHSFQLELLAKQDSVRGRIETSVGAPSVAITLQGGGFRPALGG